jgi:phage nucleotide-binding protein
MQISHSRIECFEGCPYRYKLRYIDKYETLKPDNADNPLFLGTALHTGIEKDVNTAIKEYFAQYPIISDEHINEAIKLAYQISKAKNILPQGEYEVQIKDEDFIGFIDLLVPVQHELTMEEMDEVCNNCEKNCDCNYANSGIVCKKMMNQKNPTKYYDLYDFKYSNNIYHYKESPQLHLYKYYFEKTHPNEKIRNMKFVIVPKVGIRQKKTETLNDFRQRLDEELKKTEIKFLNIDYNPEYVINFLTKTKRMLEETEFEKNEGWLCSWCEYQEYCKKGYDYFMNLPENKRRNIEKIEKKTIWLYGSPFSGKTTFANKFPDPLMLNTDGNIKFVDAPFIPIKDEVKVTGRMTQRKFAWEVFKEAIAELEKKENTFKTIIVDLLEDTYEYCRLYMYDQMGITHESDDSFRAWDKVRTEFLSTLKRLMNLDYENIILISHEDTSKDITKRGGDKITAIKPNLQEKAANKVAGMVDMVARIIADDNKRTLSFKSDEVVFGGGRLTTSVNEIDLDYDIFLEVYEEANKTAVAKLKGEEKLKTTSKEENEEKTENEESEQPKTRSRRSKKSAEMTTEEMIDNIPFAENAAENKEVDARNEIDKENAEAVEETTEEKKEEAPKATRTRKRRGE